MVSRRQLLSTCSGLVVMGSGGCLVAAPAGDDGSIPPEEFHIEVPENLQEIPGQRGEFRWSLLDGDPSQLESIDLGSRAGIPDEFGPHSVNVYNLTHRSLFELEILDGVDDSVVFEQQIAIATGAYVTFMLNEPSTYIVTISIPDTNLDHRIRVSCRFFDCNASVSHLALTEDFELHATTVSTLGACPHTPC